MSASNNPQLHKKARRATEPRLVPYRCKDEFVGDDFRPRMSGQTVTLAILELSPKSISTLHHIDACHHQSTDEHPAFPMSKTTASTGCILDSGESMQHTVGQWPSTGQLRRSR
jgi:hypothetical protein